MNKHILDNDIRITKWIYGRTWLESEKARIERDRGWKCEIRPRKKHSKFCALFITEKK